MFTYYSNILLQNLLETENELFLSTEAEMSTLLHYGLDPYYKLKQLLQILLNINDFLYIELNSVSP